MHLHPPQLRIPGSTVSLVFPPYGEVVAFFSTSFRGQAPQGGKHWLCAFLLWREGSARRSCGCFLHIWKRWLCALLLALFCTSVGRSTGFAHSCSGRRGKLWPFFRIGGQEHWFCALLFLAGGVNCGLFFCMGGQEHWFCALLFCQEGEIVALFFHIGGQEHWFCALLF